MRRTPDISAFRSFRPRDCPHGHAWCLDSRNVYELEGLENEPKLFASERMVFRDGREVRDTAHRGASVSWEFGNWDCEVLLLMQDAAPRDKIEELVDQGHPEPFSARNFIETPRAGGAATNRELHRFARRLRCRRLAGSAMIGILKPPGRYGTSADDVRLMSCPWIRECCTKVIRWVAEEERTPHLKLVVCLGRKAFEFVSEALGIAETVQGGLEEERGSTAEIGRFRVSYLWHPQPQGWGQVGRAAAEGAWHRMAIEAGLDYVD